MTDFLPNCESFPLEYFDIYSKLCLYGSLIYDRLKHSDAVINGSDGMCSRGNITNKSAHLPSTANPGNLICENSPSCLLIMSLTQEVPQVAQLIQRESY